MSDSARAAKTLDDHLFAKGPKRMLCLDGGGLRGSLTLGILKGMEARLRRRHGDPDLVLADYFDLIAGTSTGSIIAATLALGMSPQDIFDNHYRKLGPAVFRKHRWWADPLGPVAAQITGGTVRPKFDQEVLAEYLRDAVGPDTRLGSEQLRTGLLVVTKRLDTHSVWALGNNPRGDYFGPPDDNGQYLLWQVLCASAAAPTYFKSVRLDVGDVRGEFIDGGVSPFNDPSLQALMYATLEGYRVGWPMGAKNLLVVSVGTGWFEPRSPKDKHGRRAEWATVMEALLSALHDNKLLTSALMQWMSTTPTPMVVDGEMGDLSNDMLGAQPLISYARYDAELTETGLQDLVKHLPAPVQRNIDYASLTKMDVPANVELLWEIGRVVGETMIDDGHFPETFDVGSPMRDGSGTRGGASALRVGIVGHRNNVLRVEHAPALTAKVEQVLERIAGAHGGAGGVGALTVISPLAEGADRIGARAALAAEHRLECPLPFPTAEYEKDFATEESRREFHELLAESDAVSELPGTRVRATDAYAAVGADVIARSHLLIAIWDGEEARGRGGTAEVVQAAAARMPVVWIHADPAVETRLVTVDSDGQVVTSPMSELESRIGAIR